MSFGKAIVENADRSNWNQITAYLLENDFQIIALRGAGSVNGMDQAEILKLMSQLEQRIKLVSEAGTPVAVVFDGDPDSLEKPDIGYVAGRLLDRFGNNVDSICFLAAQKQSWYYPKKEGENLANIHEANYATVVFADNTFAGDHNSFTQSEELVRSARYEQWYIGASGLIATEQLADFNRKVPSGQTRKAVIYRVHNNAELNAVIEQKLAEAIRDRDDRKISKFTKQLEQRKNPYGAHWTPDGRPALNQSNFQNLDIQWVTD